MATHRPFRLAFACMVILLLFPMLPAPAVAGAQAGQVSANRLVYHQLTKRPADALEIETLTVVDR